MKDPIITRARELAKKDKRDAIYYLASEASKYTVNEDLFHKFFLKCIDYILSYSDLSNWEDTLENNFTQLFEALEKEKIYNENYKKACNALFDFRIKTKDRTGAFETIGKMSYLLTPSNTSYLLICQDMAEKEMQTYLLFNTQKEKYQGLYLYAFIKKQLLWIGWNLHVTINHNISEYESMLRYNSNDGYYYPFEMFNNIRSELIEVTNLDEYHYEPTAIEMLRVYFAEKSDLQILDKIKIFLFEKLPEKLNISQTFFEENFSDLKQFGENLENINYNQSVIMSICNDLSNEFITK